LSAIQKEPVPPEILDLVSKREEARKSGNWEKADELRKEIQKNGYSVEDTAEGPKTKNR